MKNGKSIGLAAVFAGIVSLHGCYTITDHPQVSGVQKSGYYACADCHSYKEIEGTEGFYQMNSEDIALFYGPDLKRLTAQNTYFIGDDSHYGGEYAEGEESGGESGEPNGSGYAEEEPRPSEPVYTPPAYVPPPPPPAIVLPPPTISYPPPDPPKSDNSSGSVNETKTKERTNGNSSGSTRNSNSGRGGKSRR